MSSEPIEWDEKVDITWREYFNLRFADASKYAKLLIDELGEEKAYEILDKNALEEGKEYGKEWMSKRNPLTSKDDISDFFHGLYSEPFWDKCLEVEYLESDDCFKYNVTKCIWAYTFSKLGAPEFGFHTMCMGDYGIAKGLSPHVTLKRSKTLMQGDDCCDFSWYWEEG
jgi:L-2-amino-thiazoline-4-carboxylic acid hydrolase